MRYTYGTSIAAYVIQPGNAVSGGRLAVLVGGAAVWFYNADTGGTRYTDLLDASNNPITQVVTLNASTEVGYFPKFKGPDGVDGMWADANGGSGPRFWIEPNDEKVYVAGTQTVSGDKHLTGQISSTNTHTWIMPINGTPANQISAITIENDNTVNPTDSPDTIVVWYKGNTDADRAGWHNEWGGVRVRVPNLSKLGYEDIALKLFEASTNTATPVLACFGPDGVQRFSVLNGAVTAVSLNLSGNAISANPTLATHLTTKSYVDSLVTGGAPDATTSSKGILQLAGDLGGTATSPTVPGLSSKADASNVVLLTGTQTVAGTKTFSSSPVVPLGPTVEGASTPKGYVDQELGYGATDYGFKAWNFDFNICPGAGTVISGPGAGTVRVAKIRIPTGTVTNLHMQLGTAGSGLTASQCHIGLYDSTKTLLSEATGPTGTDLATTWGGATGLLTMPLVTPQSVAYGTFYIAFFYNGTTAPAFFAMTSTKTGLANGLLSAANSMHASADTGRTTTMPTTLGTFTATLVGYCVAVS